MDPGFLDRLLTPSPVMAWLLLLFPALVAGAGIAGARRREPGSLRLAVMALLLLLWLVLPLSFADPIAQRISVMISALGWFGLLGAWSQQVWNRWPAPVWIHAWVTSHLVAILVACAVAVFRALAAGA